MTNDDGRKPEGAPERYPKGAQGAWSALQAFAQTSALQNQALVAIRRPENRENRIQLVKSG